MTIAACYVSQEGIVLGADSTTTFAGGAGLSHFNHAQKVFEVWEGGTLGVVTWGLGGLSTSSHRTLIARFGDQLALGSTLSMANAAALWASLFWTEYSASPEFCEFVRLRPLVAHDPQHPGQPGMRTTDEERTFQYFSLSLPVGFCVGGYFRGSRAPIAFEVLFHPGLTAAPAPTLLPPGHYFWGAPALVHRLIYGIDDGLMDAILKSGFWTGTPADLGALIKQAVLAHPSTVPIREAIDFTHACLPSTIKAMKFSQRPRICGGPIELAVITTDRPFRWVHHKPWDAALREG